MNERAARDGSPAALWHIEDHRSIFAGPLRYNAAHSHSVPVLIGGLYGKFSIRRAGSAWTLAQAAVVESGIPYELNVGGEPICVIYLEPSTGGSELLRPLLGDADATPDFDRTVPRALAAARALRGCARRRLGRRGLG